MRQSEQLVNELKFAISSNRKTMITIKTGQSELVTLRGELQQVLQLTIKDLGLQIKLTRQAIVGTLNGLKSVGHSRSNSPSSHHHILQQKQETAK